MPNDHTFSRRKLISSTAAAFAIPSSAQSRSELASLSAVLSRLPDTAIAWTENESIALQKQASTWQGKQITVRTAKRADGCDVSLHAPNYAVMRLHLRWQIDLWAALQFLGDDWERSYGNLAWRGMEPERIMPWYFLSTDGRATAAIGVKVAPSALCFWQVDPAGVSLWLDVRNGSRGVKPGDREIHLASIVAEFYSETSPFPAAKRFCHRMCDSPRLPRAPVYGGNNWYYAYGKSSADDIRADSERIASFATSQTNRPFMVIDDGWQPNPDAGPWTHGNDRFPDMANLASTMRRMGVQPGLWLRPLFTKEPVAPNWRLTSPNAAHEYSVHQAYTLDPTVPEALSKIQQDMRTAVAWGYSLIKHDFSTYDLLGRWGFAMGSQITDSNWNFADQTRTNAEIILDLYRALREAAGDSLVLGCNTVGHLSAGLFELQRIGDDTSGRDWNRTRKMGVNTLAFRAPQHGSFFAIDADCVGITKQIPWGLNRQWLDLLARSGTPLFVSAGPDALGPEQNSAIRQAFAIASKPAPLLEPTDWLRNTEPQNWILHGQAVRYKWFGSEGVSPFAT